MRNSPWRFYLWRWWPWIIPLSLALAVQVALAVLGDSLAIHNPKKFTAPAIIAQIDAVMAAMEQESQPVFLLVVCAMMALLQVVLATIVFKVAIHGIGAACFPGFQEALKRFQTMGHFTIGYAAEQIGKAVPAICDRAIRINTGSVKLQPKEFNQLADVLFRVYGARHLQMTTLASLEYLCSNEQLKSLTDKITSGIRSRRHWLRPNTLKRWLVLDDFEESFDPQRNASRMGELRDFLSLHRPKGIELLYITRKQLAATRSNADVDENEMEASLFGKKVVYGLPNQDDYRIAPPKPHEGRRIFVKEMNSDVREYTKLFRAMWKAFKHPDADDNSIGDVFDGLERKTWLQAYGFESRAAPSTLTHRATSCIAGIRADVLMRWDEFREPDAR